jgi:hypothetical protein
MTPISPTAVSPRRAPAKRAFQGIAGSPLAKVIPFPEPSTQAGVSSAEIEQADALIRFQQYQFDPALRGANPHFELTNPRFDGRKSSKGKHKVSHGVDAEGRSNDERRETLFGGLSAGTGFKVWVPIMDPSAHGPRKRTPWWILNAHVFQTFLRSIVDNDDEEHILKGQDLYEAAGLDYTILVDFYFKRRTDKEIYFDHIKEFKSGKGRQRGISSVTSVRKRRFDLVAAGNQEYGRAARPAQGPEHDEHLELWADIRQGPSIHTKVEE